MRLRFKVRDRTQILGLRLLLFFILEVPTFVNNFAFNLESSDENFIHEARSEL